MAKSSEEAFAELLNRKAAEAFAPTIAAFQAQLHGYEHALIAIIAALDRTGALPIAEARSAIDAMAARITDDALNGPSRQVLQRLSEALLRHEAGPILRH